MIPERIVFVSRGITVYAGDWRKLLSTGVFDVLISPYVITIFKQDIIGGACGAHGRKQKCLHFFNRKTGIKEIYIEFHGVIERGYNGNGF